MFRYEDIPVEVTASDAPSGINTFDDVQLTPIMKGNLELANYSTPTPVQKYSIPCILAKRDLMSCAQTGSGKTAAFLVPILHAILEEGPQVNQSVTHVFMIHPPYIRLGYCYVSCIELYIVFFLHHTLFLIKLTKINYIILIKSISSSLDLTPRFQSKNKF